jgi:hypothetical protein
MNKQIVKLSSLMILVAFLGVTAFGQGGNREQLKEKAKAQKVAYITSQLELTESESQKFWPIYNEYQAEREGVRKAMDVQLSKDMSDKEAEDLMYKVLDNKSKEIDIQKKYIQKMKSAIPARKIAQLFKAEKEFKEKVISHMKERRKDRQDR